MALTRSATPASSTDAEDGFRHEALLYADEVEFLDGAVPFLRAAVAGEEPALAVFQAPKIRLLRSALGGDAEGVLFADVASVAHNPARIIPALQQFLDAHAGGGGSVRGIGEPIWPGRSAAEVAECQRYESLLNVAFHGTPGLWLVCSYDTGALDPAVVEEAYRSHPHVVSDGVQRESAAWVPDRMAGAHLDDPLPEPARDFGAMPFREGHLPGVRAAVEALARRFGLDEDRTADLVVAANEIATNSLRHGGGEGTLRMWREGRSLVCEVRDAGRIDDPLAGRRPPRATQEGGRGLWLANQLCDLVQIRCFPEGTVVRLHLSLSPSL
jgi:anti-sigma regulatory factor (Ser/Thr protein kinase)